MDQDKVNAFSLVIEVASFVFAVSLSIGVGLLVGAWAGFLLFALITALFVVVLLASFRKAQREQEVDS